MPTFADLDAIREANAPRPYDLANPAEVQRLLGEVIGYMRTSLRHGTDTKGRQFALDALRQMERAGWVLVAPAAA
jgi:hypothetical protein